MNKKEMVAALAAKCDVTQKEATKYVETMFAIITDELVKGEKVAVPGFGTFEVAHKDERIGRNPKTKENITIAASNAPKFKAAKALKDSLNA